MSRATSTRSFSRHPVRSIDATARFSGGQGDTQGQSQQSAGERQTSTTSKYRGAQGLDPEVVAEIERMFGFDKPAHERFLIMAKWGHAFNR